MFVAGQPVKLPSGSELVLNRAKRLEDWGEKVGYFYFYMQE